MVAFDKDKAANRLKELRNSRDWSQGNMAQELARHVGNNQSGGKGIALDGANGKQTVSQLERGARGITIDIAFAYSEIFGVSLDYVLGKTDEWQIKYKPIADATGLSSKSIENIQLVKLKNDAMWQMDYLNYFIEDSDFLYFVAVLSDYINTMQNIPDEAVKDWGVGTHTASLSDIKATDVLLFTLQSCFNTIVRRVFERNKVEVENGKVDNRYYYHTLLRKHLGSVMGKDENGQNVQYSLSSEKYNELLDELRKCTTTEQMETLVFEKVYWELDIKEAANDGNNKTTDE